MAAEQQKKVSVPLNGGRNSKKICQLGITGVVSLTLFSYLFPLSLDSLRYGESVHKPGELRSLYYTTLGVQIFWGKWPCLCTHPGLLRFIFFFKKIFLL